MKSPTSLIAALACMAFGTIEYHKADAQFRTQRKRKKKGAGRGGFHPPRHARANAHKKVFGGICGPRIDATQFFHA